MSRTESQNEVQVFFTQTMLKRLFIKYASSNKQSMNIRLKKYVQIMQDANIIVQDIQDRHITAKKVELIFCGENKHRVNMDFETFLESLPRILIEK